MRIPRDAPIPPGDRYEPGATRRGRSSFGACSKRTSMSTVCARSGGSSAGKGSQWLEAPSARLMRAMGPKGVVRGKSVRTTIPDQAAVCPLGRVDRQFEALRPTAPWVSDFTDVATWSDFDDERLRTRRFGAGRFGPGLARASSRPGRRARAPRRQGFAIPCPALHRAARPGRCRAIRRQPSATAATPRWRRRSTACSKPG